MPEQPKLPQRYANNTKHQRRWCAVKGHLWIERNGVVSCRRCGKIFD